MAKELDAAVHQFLNRPIDDEIAFLIVDASCFMVRDGARYLSKALFVVAGIRADGNREILGAKIADGEDGLLWEGYFDELKARGLHGVKMVISDGHKGIIQAVQHSFTGAAWQLCQVHFMRNILKTVAKSHWTEVLYEMKAARNSPDQFQLSGRNYSPLAWRSRSTCSTATMTRSSTTQPFQDSTGGGSAPPICSNA